MRRGTASTAASGRDEVTVVQRPPVGLHGLPSGERSAAPDDLGVGDVVDSRYELLSPISAGAIGIVFRAKHLGTGRTVAIKIMHPRIACDLGLRERTAREARFTSAIRHPNIVEVLDAGYTGRDQPFMAMELLDGPTLRAWMRNAGGPPTLAEVGRIASMIASAIAAAHAAHIVHRDLKPENIVLVDGPEGPVPKILDFGFAAAVDVEPREDRLTVVGTVLGTYAYMAPEQAIGAAADTAFDIYAFGVILHELLTGELPYAARGDTSILYAKTLGVVDGASMDHARIPPPWRELVEQCLSLDPLARPDAAALMRSLARVRGGGTVSPPQRARLALHPILAFPIVLVAALVAAPMVIGQASSQPEAPPQHAVALELDDDVVVLPEPQPEEVVILEPEPAEVAASEPSPRAAPLPARRKTASVADPVAARPVVGAKPPIVAGKPVVATCEPARVELDRAVETFRWIAVLSVLDDHDCWSANERTRWRTKALLELQRFDACAQSGSGSADAEIRRWTTLCERRAQLETPSDAG